MLFAVALIGALAFIGGGSSNGNVHTMPGGQTMTAQMTTAAAQTHTMTGGSTMPGMTMP